MLVTDAANPAPALPEDIAGIIATPPDQRDRDSRSQATELLRQTKP